MPSSTSSSERPASERRELVRAVAALAAAALVAWVVLGVYARPPGWGPRNARVLFVGSSRTDAAVLPRRLSEPAGKMTFFSLDLELAEAALAYHRDAWPDLALVVVELTEFTLYGDAVGFHYPDPSVIVEHLDLPVWAFPERPGHWPRRLWRLPPGNGDRLRREWELRSVLSGEGLPWLRPGRRPLLETVLVRSLGQGEIFGLRGRDPARRFLDPEHAEARVLASRGLEATFGEASLPANREALTRMAETLAGQGVRLVLLTPPLHPELLALRPERWGRVQRETIEELRSRPGLEALPWWDHSADPGVDPRWFLDPDHLDAEGARRFTATMDRRIAHELETPHPAGPPG